MHLADFNGSIWLSPIYESPMVDFGYDISNFTRIDPIFGTTEDLRSLIDKAHQYGIRVVLDFIPNHSSDLHPWFQKSLRNEKPYSDYYVWADPIGHSPDGQPIPPSNWVFFRYFFGRILCNNLATYYEYVQGVLLLIASFEKDLRASKNDFRC